MSRKLLTLSLTLSKEVERHAYAFAQDDHVLGYELKDSLMQLEDYLNLLRDRGAKCASVCSELQMRIDNSMRFIGEMAGRSVHSATGMHHTRFISTMAQRMSGLLREYIQETAPQARRGS